MTVLEVAHLDKAGTCLWRQENILNTLHTQGQEFITKALFCGLAVPSAYYVGLDNRTTVNIGDTLPALSGEPSTNGYHRYAVSSTSGFTPVLNVKWSAQSVNLLFSAVSGSWGPVRNAFIATAAGSNGYLISTSRFNSARTVNSGEVISFRFSLSPAGA